MINLITGLPGNGKTLYTIATVKAIAEKDNRPVYYARIKGLKLPWTLVDPYEWFKCPPNSIIVIDECQRSDDPGDPKAPVLFGLRKRGDPVPRWAAELETHRHLGIDLYLITQDAGLIDPHDRKLAGLHFHVKRTFGLARATVHEFSGVRDNAQKSASGSVRHEWGFPKEAYSWYESAEVHTGKARVPFKVWVFLSLPFIIGALSWLAWSRYLDPHRVKGAGYVMPTAGTGGASVGGGARGPMTAAQYVEQFRPRVQGLEYTAPVYDEVTKPVEAPYPAACVQMAERCDCYTQQGTKLATLRDLCVSIVHGGFYVAWQQQQPPPHQALQALTAVRPPEQATAALSLGGETGGRIAKPAWSRE